MGGSPDWDEFFENCGERRAKALFRSGFSYDQPEITSISFLGMRSVRSDLQQRERRANRIEELLARADAALDAGDIEDAARAIKRLKQMEPDEPRVESQIATMERGIKQLQAHDDKASNVVRTSASGFYDSDDDADEDEGSEDMDSVAYSTQQHVVLTPEEQAKIQQAQIEQDLDSWVDSDALARELSKESPSMQAVYLGILGATMYMSVQAVTDDDTEDSDVPEHDRIDDSIDWASQLLMPAGLGLGSIFLYMVTSSTFSTNNELKALARDLVVWERQLRNECRSGVLASCDEAVSLSRKFRDLSKPALERELSSPWRGLGSVLGPSWEVRVTAGFSKDAFATIVPYEREDSAYPHTYADQVEFEGPMDAGTWEFVMRVKSFRTSFSYTRRYGKLIDDEQYDPDRIRHTPLQMMTSYSGGLGIQFAQGLFSPYAELRVRLNSMENQDIARDKWSSSWGNWHTREPQTISVPVENDRALVIGNTFNFSGVRSTRGPNVAAFVVDVAYVLPPEESPFDPGFSISVGYSIYQPFGFGRYAR
ncbi:MAG: hypothetical protein K9N11_09265 [Lentisphaeria bacterium]|nr:hypothetical protein [Candidatus Neomarinimicrobiota bacterium]MCF7843027.1 hypothetical protein [Lentisphaeria bacterium]